MQVHMPIKYRSLVKVTADLKEGDTNVDVVLIFRHPKLSAAEEKDEEEVVVVQEEMKQIRRQPRPREGPVEILEKRGSTDEGLFDGGSVGYGVVVRPLLVIALFMLVLLLVVFWGAQLGLPLDVLLPSFTASKDQVSNSSCSASSSATAAAASPPPPSKEKFLRGLLSNAHSEASCFSRYHSALYRKPSPHTPSPHLIAKLRSYEALHKKCGPNTDLYRETVQLYLKSNHTRSGRPIDCNYVVWLPADGLGNRLISITSAFLFALLNNKVLLLDLPEDMRGLFCEPFPDTSWIIPSDFSIKNLNLMFEHHPRSYGNMLKSNRLAGDNMGYLYLHLLHGNDDFDKMFYCEEGQRQLQKYPWLLLRSNVYFAPGFFFVSDFEDELKLLFPERSTVFHHLGRYLFNPSNQVWGYITRYHDAYLANAREKLGIQIRIFAFANVEFDVMLSQIVNCTLKEKLLPEVDLSDSSALPSVAGAKPKAILVTSLLSGYLEKLRDRYYEHATTSGEVIAVYQPSHEEEQHTEKLTHNMKAFAEIYLLSLSDELITSPFSTFGYVAHGLGGLRPWILVRREERGGANCVRSMSMEPCFLSPPSYDCRARRKVDRGSVVAYVRHCEDFPPGIKLFDY